MSNAVDFFTADQEPYYLPLGDEVDVFRAAYGARLPVLLKGPTGCGKTRFVEHMAWRLYRETANQLDVPLITVSCHEDLTATDMVGRYLLKGDEEREIRDLFSSDALSFYEADGKLSTEAVGKQLIHYRAGKRVAPERLSDFIRQGVQVLTLLRPKRP